VISFVHPLSWGLLIGTAAGTLQLLSTALDPLADDSAGSCSPSWQRCSCCGCSRASDRPRAPKRIRDVVVSGIVIGAVTMAVAYVSSIVRVNLFLDQISGRADWVNLMARFRASDFHSLRAYANYEYLGSLPILLALGAVAGDAAALWAERSGDSFAHRSPTGRSPSDCCMPQAGCRAVASRSARRESALASVLCR
jgi:hypothetical protein